MENKICVYAICKNEIQFVDKWLDSMSEADYIVVLDTGSTDGTFEKLKADPRVTKVRKKVIDPWRFDVARNESLKLVPKDANILFSTDLDELLDPGWGELIRRNWTENTWRGHYKYVWSHTDAGTDGLTFEYDKLHNRDYKWKFAVHEVLWRKDRYNELDPGLEDGHVISFGEQIVLHHYPDLSKSRSNYLNLLELRVQENPEDVYSKYLLGREYGVYERYDDALNCFAQVLEMPTINKYVLVKITVLGYMGDIFVIKNDINNAINAYNTQMLCEPSHREPYICLAELYIRRGMFHTALGLIEDAEKLTYQHFDWSERSTTWNEKPWDIRSIAYMNLDRYQEALECVIKALQSSPLDKRIQHNYLAILDKLKEMK